MATKRDKYQRALYALVLELPLATRRRCETHIKTLQDLVGDDTDFFVDRRGKHWSERRSGPRLLVKVRGQGSQKMSYEEASELVRRSSKQLQLALSIGRGIAHFRDGDDIIEIQRL